MGPDYNMRLIILSVIQLSGGHCVLTFHFFLYFKSQHKNKLVMLILYFVSFDESVPPSLGWFTKHPFLNTRIENNLAICLIWVWDPWSQSYQSLLFDSKVIKIDPKKSSCFINLNPWHTQYVTCNMELPHDRNLTARGVETVGGVAADGSESTAKQKDKCLIFPFFVKLHS